MKHPYEIPKCPVCGTELEVQYDAGHYIIWCKHGPCESYAANSGAVATSMDAAMSKLLDRIEKERGESSNE